MGNQKFRGKLQMKLIGICMLLLLFTLPLKASKEPDYKQIDEKTLAIPDALTKTTGGIASYINSNFETQSEKTRAVFIWITTNIRYDIEHMYAINFYEKKEDKINKALKTRRGICSNYAALFDDICTKTGIKSYTIEGYTQQKGFTDYLPHAWCAAEIDDTWFLFDPTWGAGYVRNGKFYSEVSNKYFKVAPADMIKNHMPFDYLWQFLHHPVTNQEFYDGKTQETNLTPYFSYPDSIAAYEKLSENDKLIATARRIEKNGIKNSMIFDRLQHLKNEIEVNRQNKAVGLYNAAVADGNEGIALFNAFIDYKNKQFIPLKSDAEIRNMIVSAERKLKEARAKINAIQDPTENISSMMTSLLKLINELTSQVNSEKEFLNLYFTKDANGRKAMFYK